MKTVRKKHTDDQNCSCTSCVHKSGSDNPSLRRFTAQGSRIDRFYHGKYIPSRERKLLSKLVRTRAVYDDIRAQLISESTISLSTKADSEHRRRTKESDDIEKGSGAILELVDLVDKGATLGLSECCSCCSCSSKAHHEDHTRHKRHRSLLGSRRQGFQKERLDMHRKKKGVHFTPKYIKSDSCICTFKFSGLLKKKKKDFDKTNTPMEYLDLQSIGNEEQESTQKKVQDFARRSYENIKQSNKQIGEKMLEGINKVKESKTKIKERLLLDAQSSVVKLKQTTNRLKSKMKTGPPKKLSKTNIKLNDLLAICICPEDQIFEKSSKESVLDVYKQKSKEKIIQAKKKLKSAMKSTIERRPKSTKINTEPPKKLSKTNLQLNDRLAICICPEEEISEKSSKESVFDVYKEKSKEKIIQAKNKLKSAMKSTIERRPKSTKIKTKPPKKLSKTNLKLNDRLGICICPEEEISEKSEESVLDAYKEKSKQKIIQAKNKLKSAMKSTIERRPKSTKIKTRTSGTYFAPERDLAFQVKKDSIRKFQEELRRKQIIKDWECDPGCDEDFCNPEECFIKLKKRRKIMKHRGLEHQTRKHEKKTGPVLKQKNVKIQNKALTLDAKNMNQKPVAEIQETGETNESLVSQESLNKGEKKNKGKSKKPKTGQKRKKKDLNLMPKEKVISPEKRSSSRQGVRIKSSFSLNIQFYKEIPPSETAKMTPKESTKAKPTPSGIKYKIAKNPKVYRNQRTSQIVIKRSSRDTQTDARSLKRCFCVLKLKSKKTKGKHKKKTKVTTAEKSITTLGRPVEAPCKRLDCSVEMCDKRVCETLVLKKLSNAHTNTANRIKNKRDINSRYLLPYECEPGVCTPGDCDPYQCIKLINMREAKDKKPCFCHSRKTKSTSSLTSRSYKHSKATIAQSMSAYGTTQKRNEGNSKLERKQVHNAYGRQAVKIGSTFSFNIEFYKDKIPQYYSPPSDLKTLTVKPKLKVVSKPKLKERAFQGDVASFNKNVPTQMYKKERHASMSTTLKRCFCTLKLQRKSHSKLKRKKMNTTGTIAREEPLTYIETSTKGTKTKQKYLQSLKPYECEPFTCIPGECNPYECLERINRRNLRDVGVSSPFNRSEINKGSSTSEKSLKSAKTQSKPRSREQKVLTKVRKPKRQIEKLKENIYYSSSAPSKQAVRVGSTFSFNIQFYKNQVPINKLIPDYQMRPAVKLDTKPITKNKGVKIVKLNVANLDTQVEELKKRNKTSTTKPLLKRCFCTLNLQKNPPLKSSIIHPKVYTVNTAMIKHDRLSMFRKNICLSKSANTSIKNNLNGKFSDYVIKSLYNECKKLSSVKHLQCQSCHPLITKLNKIETIKSNFNTALRLISQSYISDNLKLSGNEHSQLVNGSYKDNEYSSNISQERKCVVYTSNKFIREKSYFTGLRQYLKGYFCTMNLQVVRNKNVTSKQKNMYSEIGAHRPRKLKPYECEPGVCVPGECDPYECLKLISKRDSNFSKKIGTESTLTSASSYTNRTPKYKSYKVQSPSQKTTKPRVSRNYRDQYNLGETKAVRVGSSFSFDIKFIKNSEPSQKVTKQIKTSKLSSATKPSMPKKTKASKTTKMNEQDFRNQHSQSAFSKTLQKASSTLPRMKRCFCTLKLQKKGRLQKEEPKQPSEGLQTDAVLPQLTTVDRGQKAPKFKPLKVAQSLKPYECQPGICIPGQCNPYECLEIMKRLNYNQTADLGTDAIVEESKSIASMTASDRKYKTRTVNAKPVVVSKTIRISEGKQKRRVQPTTINKPTKQAVRIGSSFSFDIEFHKSQSSSDHQKDHYEYVTKKPSKRFQHTMPDLKKHRLKLKQRALETSKARRHQQSQIKSKVHAASTMTTSFMKRCFCVLKLRKNKKYKMDTANVVKNKIDAANAVKMIDKPLNVDQKTNTKRYKERILQLEPYECEPGICIPGECNPYVCEKLIKRRNNLRSRSSSTGFTSTRTTSSSSPRSGAKNINTQFRTKQATRETKKQVYTKTKIRDSNRQVVRIGSNFSFNVEFYKNKTSKSKDYDIPKTKIKEMLYVKEKKKKQKNSGTKSESVSFKSQMSQMKVNRKDFAAGINNVIKRCFCTLQLYNQRSRKNNKTKENKPIKTKEEKPVKKEVHSASVMTTEKKKNNFDSLQPYECEPNICIPYECDPYECEKLIKLRQKKQRQREIGMTTHHLRKQSAASSTEPFKRSKKRTQSISFKTKEKIQKVSIPKRIQQAQSKQCVRIGSSFSFDIEFFKNKNLDGSRLDHKAQYVRPKHSVPKLNKVSRRKKTKNQGLQSQKHLQASPSQIENEMKTKPTMARITPPLKRCFCTFYLKKPIDNDIERRVSDKSKLKYKSKPRNTTNYNKPAVKIVKQVDKKLDHKIQNNRGNQSPYIKQSSKSSAVGPFLKRCFCTLKLQKRPVIKVANTTLKNEKKNIENVNNKKVESTDRGTLTKKYKNKIQLAAYECEPFTCIPGECDPYECLRRIKARNFKSKTRSTQMLKQNLQKGVGINLANLNSKKIQSNLLSNEPISKVNKEYNIVEVPRFGNLFNKQAVKISSNFSFNIEFYKELLPPTTETYPKVEKIEYYKETRPKKSKRYSDAIMTSKVVKHHKGIQGDSVKTDTKALEVGNALKRCFCTLKLQKELNSKLSNPNIQNPRYPQVIEVRRVGVQRKGKKQTFPEVKSVSTKTKAKYLNYKTLNPQEMQVIFPYKPSKFNKTPSKTLQNKELFNETNTKQRKTKVTNRAKRLTKKKSKNFLPKNQLHSNPSKHNRSTFKKMVCKCAHLFSKKTPAVNIVNSIDEEFIEQNEIEYSSRSRKRNMGGIKRDQHSQRYGKKYKECNEYCPFHKYQDINSYYQAGDATQNPTMSLKMIKKHQNDTFDNIAHKKQNMAKDFGHQKKNKKIKQLQPPRNESEDFFCTHCKSIKMNKRHSQPLKVHFLDTPIIKNKDLGKNSKAKDGLALLNKSADHIDKHGKSKRKKTTKKDIQSRQIARYCNYCTSCGANLNNEEILKAAGDQKTNKNVKNKQNVKNVPKEKTPSVHQSTSDRIKNLFKFKQSVDNICSAKGPEKPLFEMHLDSDDYGILNKDEVLDKVTKLSKRRVIDKHLDKRHGKSCRCCICLAKRNKTGATFSIPAKGSKFGKLFGEATSLPTGKPCVCGSSVCAEKLKMMKKEFHGRKTRAKPCVCGSPICAAETKKINEMTCICAEVRDRKMQKQKAEKKNLKDKQYAKRRKKYDKNDATRSKQRRLKSKLLDKKLNKNASDVVLVAESLIDVGKLGITAATDILRVLARTAIDPKHAYTTLKEMKANPSLITKYLKTGFGDSGVAAAGRRIRLRCLSMRGVQNVKNLLERYPLTNYLLYIAHKDPKRRLPKRRPRQREQLDFNCSLFVGSLRKKPCVCIYNRFPWFYPHFLSLVNIWKQFTDIALFLLAVVVWSPCIFCMEACRAFMCCFFCTA